MQLTYLRLAASERALRKLSWAEEELLKTLLAYEQGFYPLSEKLSTLTATRQGLLAPANLSYAFVDNNPALRIDLLGLALCSPMGGGGPSGGITYCVDSGMCFAAYAGPGPGGGQCMGQCKSSTDVAGVCYRCDCVPVCQ